MINIFDINK